MKRNADIGLFTDPSTLIKEAVPEGVPNFKKLLMGRIDMGVYAESGEIKRIIVNYYINRHLPVSAL